MYRNKRIRIECFFSVKKENSETVQADIAKTLSKKYGGCSFAGMQGIWREDGNQDKDAYTGEMQTNQSINLTLSVLPGEKKECLQVIKVIFQNLSKAFDDFSAIHVEIFETEAHHFIV